MERPEASPTFWRQTGTLLRRNAKLKLRSFGKTTYEILYPVYFVLILVIISVSTGSGSGRDWPAEVYQPTPVLTSPFLSPNGLVLCAPNDTDTVSFMDAAVKRMGMVNVDVIGLASSGDMDVWRRTDGRAGSMLGAVAFDQPTNALLDGARNSNGAYSVPFTLRFNATQLPPNDPLVDRNAQNCRGGSEVETDRTNCPSQLYVVHPVLTLQMAVTTEFTNRIRAGGGDDAAVGAINVSVGAVQMPSGAEFIPSADNIGSIMPLFLCLGFFPVIQFLLTSVVTEKEKGRKVHLQIQGMRTLAFWVSWGLVYWAAITCSIIIMTILIAATNTIPNLNGGVLFLFLFIFGMAIVAQSFALSTFFSKPKVAGFLGMLLTIVSSVLFYALKDAPVAVKYVTSLLPPVAVTLGANYVLDRRTLDVTVNISNMFEGANYSLGSAILMLLLDTVLYFVLTWYLDQVIPTEYGVQRKWYFVLQPKTYRHAVSRGETTDKRVPSSANVDTDGNGGDATPDTELEGHCDPEAAALRINHLTKRFVSRKTVTNANEDVNFTASNGEILGLLGHNGAGKSTLISMLVGLTKPTSGTASVFAMTIDEDMDKIREQTGFVPQSNDILYDELTCLEHMDLVAGIKGLQKDQTEKRSLTLLDDVGLSEATNQRAGSMSGGQKRKLCLAMALISSPSLLILDEHSTGVDILARRQIWRLLQRNRQHRVTLIASHFLDEVEALCDRVVVLDHGHVRCMGTPLQLKSEFQIAYTLQLAAPSAQHGEVLTMVQQFVSDAVLETDADDTNAAELYEDEKLTLRVRLPIESVDRFSELFEALEGSEGRALGVSDIALSLPTLEQVFIKIEEESALAARTDETTENVGEDADVPPPTVVAVNAEEDPPIDEEILRAQKSSQGTQFRTMMKLHYLSRKREGAYWIFVVVIPILLMIAGLLLARQYGSTLTGIDAEQEGGTLTFPQSFQPLRDELRATTDDFRSAVSFDTGVQDTWASSLISLLPSPTFSVTGGIAGLTDYLLDRLSSSDTLSAPVLPSGFVLLGATGDIGNVSSAASVQVGLSSNFTYVHELPTASARFSTALLRLVSNKNELSFSVSTLSFASDTLTFDSLSFFAGMLLSTSFTFGAGAGAFTIVDIREQELDHALRMTGVLRKMIWLTTFTMDVGGNLIIAIASIIIVAAFQVSAFSGLALVPYTIGVLLFAVLAVLHAYVWSFAFHKLETVTSILPSIFTLSSAMPFTALFFIGLYTSFTVTTIVNVIFLVFVPGSSISSLLYFLIQFDTKRRYSPSADDDPTLGSYFSTDAMVFPALVAMVGHSILSVFLIYYFDVVQYRKRLQANQKRWQSFRTTRETAGDRAEEEGDVDVAAEKARVQQLFGSGGGVGEEARRCHIAAHNVTVAYEKKALQRGRRGGCSREREFKVAVEELSIAIAEGNRVGLLGPNGAGKTSLLSVLTGSIGASDGDAYVGGYNVARDPLSAFLATGYTPQHNRLFKKLTMREHLAMFARLKGVREDQLDSIVQATMVRLGVLEHADKHSEKLSGGTKRKLELALGTMGAPTAQFHDEPSSGLDIYAQQHMWQAVRERTRHSSAIISTHSMSEASALCNFIVIMTKGHMRCMGTPQHLLKQYGKGFVIEVHCDVRTVAAVGRFVGMLFPDAVVLDSFAGHSRFKVLTTKPHIDKSDGDRLVDTVMSWQGEALSSDEQLIVTTEPGSADLSERIIPSFAVVFHMFKQVKEHLLIEDFAFSQPTLEQIFNRFAMSSEDGIDSK